MAYWPLMGHFSLCRPIRSCCDNKSQNTTSQGFIKARIYFSLADLWMSCCSSKLAWAQVLGQLHSLRPACQRRVPAEESVAMWAWSSQCGPHKHGRESSTRAASPSLYSELAHPLVCPHSMGQNQSESLVSVIKQSTPPIYENPK